jgi:hypothetical protein
MNSVFTPRQQQMLVKLANFILPRHSPTTDQPVFDIVNYLETFLSAFDQDPPKIYAGGPFSGRHPIAGDPAPSNAFAEFLPLSRYQRLAWKLRLGGPESLDQEPFIFLSDDLKNNYTGLRDILSEGLSSAVALEDGMAPRPVMAGVLLSAAGPDFNHVFFGLLAEAAFSAPEYKGNLAAWPEIFYPGDSLAAGYSGAEISDPAPGQDPFSIQPLAKVLFDLAVTFMKGRKFK